MLNYTTKIEARKTVGEVQELLAGQGARKIIIDYDDTGQPTGLTFIIMWQGIPTLFALPCRYEGVQRALAKNPKIGPTGRSKEQALRVAWRVIKDWVAAQLAIIEAEAVSLPEVFLPYAVTKDGGTLYELALSKREQLQLSAPGGG